MHFVPIRDTRSQRGLGHDTAGSPRRSRSVSCTSIARGSRKLLARIPADVAIWDADYADIGPDGAAEELWALVRRTGDRKDTANRRTSAFKLCARKRPALLPVYDTEVEHFFPPENGNWWLTARRAMQRPALRERLSALHRDAAVPAQVTLLRTLDVVLWMEARHRRGGNCGHFRG